MNSNYFPFLSSPIVNLHHRSWHLGVRVLPVPVLHDLARVLQHQSEAVKSAGHVAGPSPALRGHHLPVQVPDGGHPRLCWADGGGLYCGPGGWWAVAAGRGA